MKKLTIILFALMLCAPVRAASMTLVKRELFQNVGTITSGSPGQFDSVTGTLYKRPGGPYVSPATAGYSADPQNSASSAFGKINLSGGSKYMVGAWFFLKSSTTSGANESPILWQGASTVFSFRYACISNSIWAGREFVSSDNSVLPISAANTWVWLAIGVESAGGANFNARYYYKTVGGSLTNWKTLSNVGTYSAMAVGAGGIRISSSPTFNGRIGAVSVYSVASLDDIVYPGDLVEPVAPMAWYVNPATGSDSNDGISSGTAWATVTKVNTESANCGIFPATSYTTGDTLWFDTSGGQLDLFGTNLVFQTRGLKIKSATGALMDFKTWHTLTNASFTKTASFTNTYQVADAQANTVSWEDTKCMTHVTGANWAAAGNLVDATPGTFFTDGTNFYIHPFGNTDPTTDAKVYERSYLFTGGSANAAVVLNAGDIYAEYLSARKTALISQTDNTDAVATTGIATGGTFGGTSILTNLYVDRFGKHGIGLLADATNSTVWISGQAEQGSPTASQSPWVSYMALSTSTGNTHSYLNCNTINGEMLAGSTNGTTTHLNGVFLSHNNGSGVNFGSINFTNCYFPLGQISPGVTTNVVIDSCRVGGVTMNEPSTVIQRSRIDYQWLYQNYTTSPSVAVRNCIFTPTAPLSSQTEGCTVRGSWTMEGNTFDLSGITTPTNSNAGVLKRTAAATALWRNNAVIVPNGTAWTVFYSFANTDAITSTNNVYFLGSALVAGSYNDGSTTANRTFAQWQSLGFDANSQNANPIVRSDYRIESWSPCRNAGADLGPLTDYTGKTFQIRKDVGAYQWQTLNPQLQMGLR